MSVFIRALLVSACATFASIPLFAAAPNTEAIKAVTPSGVAVIANASPELAIQIAKDGRWLVLQLVADDKQREVTEQQVGKVNLQGFIRVAVLSADKKVPLAQHMANAVVVTDSAISEAEALRVLTPVRGKAWVNGKELTKPMPTNYGEWTHWAANAESTRTSKETGLQIPNAVRWMAGPWYGDDINANGWRLSGGLAAAELNIASTINIEVRDAFNGVVLWRKSQPLARGFHSKTMPTMLVDGIYLRPDESSAGHPIAAINANTGKQLHVFDGALTTDERGTKSKNYGAIAADGFLFYSGDDTARCYQLSTGMLAWSYKHTSNLVKPTMAGEVVVFIEEGDYSLTRKGLWGGRYPAAHCLALVAVDAKTGKLAWRLPLDPQMADLSKLRPGGIWDKSKTDKNAAMLHSMAYSNGRIFCLNANDANGGKPAAVWAVDVKSGQTAWVAICGPTETNSMFDLYFLQDGSILTYGHTWARLDQKTGALLGSGGIGGNGRCDTGTATADLVTAGFGNYFKLDGHELERTKRDIIRSECGGFVTPGYGMVFGQSSGCGCMQPIRAVMALQQTELPQPISDEARLSKGTAYDKPLGPSAKSNEWPAYLGSNERYSATASSAPAAPKEAWKLKLGEPLGPKTEGTALDWRLACFNVGPVTSPVIADGLVVVAVRDEHAVVAIDAASGKEKWRFIADGRLINPPTLYKGRVIFGTRGGRVYNLELKTGELAWTFLAAPEHRYITGYGQLESAWPLHGSLPVVDDVIVASAGVHGEVDGGVYAWGLDAKSGQIQWKQVMYREPRTWVPASNSGSGDPPNDKWINAGQSDGKYNVTKLNNMDIPMIVNGAAAVAMQWLDAKTGQPKGPGDTPRITFNQIYPFFNMRVENRGGPHGSGAWHGFVGEKLVGDFRSGGEEAKWAWGNGRYYANYVSKGSRTEGAIYEMNPADVSGRTKPLDFGKPIATVPTVAAQSVVVAGKQVVAAGEKQPGTDPTLPVPGWLTVAESGGQSTTINMDAAAITCGVAVADGKIFVVCQDGTLRCYGN